MSFFESDMVKKELDQIAEIQREIVKQIPSFFVMSSKEKLEHISLLEDLLEKQKILYTRLTLSDDPDAIKMKEQMVESAKILGFGSNPDVKKVFDSMKTTIENLKRTAKMDR